MDNIIQQILEIDAKAQQKLQQAYAQRDEQKSQIDADAQKAADALRLKCESRIQRIDDSEKQEAEAQIAAIRRDTTDRQAAMEAHFQENQAAWIHEIVDAVLRV